jgi:putative intracellular protease/amidase
MHTSGTAAIVVYQGVSFEEAEIIRFVLSRLPGIRTVTVGTSRSTFAGPGGVETAEATLAEIGNPEIVAVPGGIGSDRREAIADWLQTVSPRWILASSTGTALLAAAGLLRDATAATHWLAGPLLERYGAHPSREHVVVDGPIITCSGTSSAFRGALIIAERYGGPELVRRIRAEAPVGGKPEPPRPPFWLRLWNAGRRALHKPEHAYVPNVPVHGDVEVLDLGVITLQPRSDHSDDA